MEDKNEKKEERKGRRWRRQMEESEFEGDFFVLPPDMEDDAAILHTVAPAEDSPEAIAAAQNIVMLEDVPSPEEPEEPEEMGGTRVVELDGDEAEENEVPAGATREVLTLPDDPSSSVALRPRRAKPKATDEVEGQLKLDDWEEELKLGEDWQERLRRTRQEQIEDFERRREKAGMKISGEEEQNDPVEEPPAPEEEPESDELEDYSSYEETAAVRGELDYRYRVGWLTLAATAIPEFLLLWLAMVAWAFHNVFVPHIVLTLVLLLVMMAANLRVLLGGWKSIFHLAGDANTPVAVASTVTLIHTVVQLFNTAQIGSADEAPLLLPCVAGMGLLLNVIGRLWRIARIRSNFRVVSYEGDKVAACRIDDPEQARQIGRSAVAMGVPEVCYFKNTRFLTGFLLHSYAEDIGDEQMRLYQPIAFGVSLLLSIPVFILTGSVFTALSVFTAAVCVSAPMGMLTAINFPLWRTSRRLVRHGAMISGWDAVEEFGGVHAMTVDALELFPENSVLLHGIKTFSGTPIDRAIIDAASVVIQAGGPLAGVFKRVLEDDDKLLQPVESLMYEQDMGVSGWVGGRRVLVGNRRLLENHGVDVPSHDYELRYTRGDRQIVYLSTAGELSAMFVVSYLADEEIEEALDTLTKGGITLLIRTCDPNVNEDLVCRTYGLDRYYVEVLGASAGRLYMRLQSEEFTDREALVASNGWLQGKALALASCRRIKASARLAVIIQLIGCVLGLALTGFAVFLKGAPSNAISTAMYVLLVTAISWLVPVLKRR